MKTFIASLLAVALISVAAGYVLNEMAAGDATGNSDILSRITSG